MSLLKYSFFFAPCYTKSRKSERHKPIERRKAEVNKSTKQTYKGLSLAEMENYITEQDKTQGNGSKGMEAFKAIKAYYTPKGSEKPSYPKVKAWFLNTYPKYGKKDDNTNQSQTTEKVSA